MMLEEIEVVLWWLSVSSGFVPVRMKLKKAKCGFIGEILPKIRWL